MSEKRAVEVPLFSKAPFANYDIIVYFGGGLLSLLLIYWYIFSPIEFADLGHIAPWIKRSVTHQIIFALITAALAYLSGHLVAYMASHFIEGFINKTCGSFSQIILLSTREFTRFRSDLNKQIDINLRANLGWTKSPLVWLAHVPFAPWYFFVKRFGLFESLDTRLPKSMVSELERRVQGLFPNITINSRRQWFRWVEYYTYYNAPVAAASMYNYLIISGFMRTVAMIMLFGVWGELAHAAYATTSDGWIIHRGSGIYGTAAYIFAFAVGYVCALTAYVKFYRRYVEEAIMGFILEVPAALSSAGPTVP